MAHVVPLCAPFSYETKSSQGSRDSGALSSLGSLIVSLSPAPLRCLLFLIPPTHAQDFLADEMDYCFLVKQKWEPRARGFSCCSLKIDLLMLMFLHAKPCASTVTAHPSWGHSTTLHPLPFAQMPLSMRYRQQPHFRVGEAENQIGR